MNCANLFSLIGPALPEVFLAVGTLVNLLLGVFVGNNYTKMIARFAILVLLITLTIMLKFPVANREYYFNNLFVTDSFNWLIKSIILIGASVTLILYSGTARKENYTYNFEFPILILFSVIGMLIMLSAGDFLSLYLGLEMQSLSLYVLAAYERNDSKSSEAGLKYFVLGALASGIILYGISLIYGFTGTTNFASFANILQTSSTKAIPLGVLIGLILVIIGFCFKVAAAPFHMWITDVYEGSPTIVTAYFAIVPKIASVAVIMQLLSNPFGVWAAKWQQIIIFVSIASMIIGALGGIRQMNFKRLLAYSSISHIGFMLLGVATGSKLGMQSVFMYIIIYAVMSLGIFTAIMSMRHEGDKIESFTGLSEKNPFLALAISVYMLSMAGIPPLAGFFAKFYVLSAAIKSNMYIVAVIGVVTSVISAYYYLKIIKIMYFDKSSEPTTCNWNQELLFLTVIAIAFNLFFFLFSGSFVKFSFMAVSKLYL